MKLFIPIFKNLPIDTGFSIQNLGLLRGLKKQPELFCRLWNGFTLVDSLKISFNSAYHMNRYLNTLFPETFLSQSRLATLEFDLADLNEEDKIKVKQNLFEAEVTLKAKDSGSWTTVLYDFITDKKSDHRYTPILHSAHTADVGTSWDSFVLLLNFRPDYLKVDKKTQTMHLELKSPAGALLNTKDLEIPFNSTETISFREEFALYGSFQPGSQINIKGGESQFAIFTLFWNSKTQSLGLEHSLPPVYYCKGIFEQNSRKTFYQNAFKTARDTK